MNITIFPPEACSEQGRRSNNQDSIFPKHASSLDKLFLVCDGVGGMSQGAEASRIVCEMFGAALAEQPFSDPKIIDDALRKAETALNAFAHTLTLPKGMATTLTLLHLHAQGATIAHIGDSRVYQIRAGKVLFKTHDHSWVNELVSQGVITPAQALTHPQRNVIARAIQVDKPAKADVTLRTDLQPNDYFLMCSDGIFESCAEESLLQLLQQDRSNAEKLTMIQEQCRLHSKDNFSCYLIQIQSVTHEQPTQMARVQSAPQEETTVRLKAVVQDQATQRIQVVPQEQPTQRLQATPQDQPTELIQMERQPFVHRSTIQQNQNRRPQTTRQRTLLWVLLALLLCLVTMVWWLNGK